MPKNAPHRTHTQQCSFGGYYTQRHTSRAPPRYHASKKKKYHAPEKKNVQLSAHAFSSHPLPSHPITMTSPSSFHASRIVIPASIQDTRAQRLHSRHACTKVIFSRAQWVYSRHACTKVIFLKTLQRGVVPFTCYPPLWFQVCGAPCLREEWRL